MGLDGDFGGDGRQGRNAAADAGQVPPRQAWSPISMGRLTAWRRPFRDV